jgi:methylenetetrahydrofolate reductase (NADPH)
MSGARIIDILKERRTISFEVFPPKPDDDADLKGIYSTIARLSRGRPDFISVTYSPAGRNKERGIEIAEFIRMAGLVPMSHFTAVGYLKEDVDDMLERLESRSLGNILALRGDVPAGFEFPHPPWRDFRYAVDLIEYIKAKSKVCVCAAAYPEAHPECRDLGEVLGYMKRKEETGADFFITQFFFDNDAYFRFLDKARARGVKSPILPGIMPVLKARQIGKMVQLSGCSVPPTLKKALDLYAEDPAGMEKAGIQYAARQIEELWHEGVDGVHLYTMNKPEASLSILESLELR